MDTAAGEHAGPLRGFWTVVGLVLALSLVLKLPTFGLSHNEPDEVIYWSLAHNLADNGSYSLRGTKVLELLPAEMYDRPLFHHPPLYPLLLLPFTQVGTRATAATVSWVGHFACILAIALIGRALLTAAAPRAGAYSPVFWVPLLAVGLDPILTFLSRKLWIENAQAGFAALALAAFVVAPTLPRRRALQAMGGALLGLSALCKLTSLGLIPAVAAFLWWTETSTRERVRAAIWTFLPLAALVLPWELWFLAETGQVLPVWVRPSPEVLAMDAFMKEGMERAPSYYLVKLVLVQPVLLLCVGVLVRRRLGFRDPVLVGLLVWIGSGLLASTLLCASGSTPYNMRYLAPMMPALYALLAWILAREQQQSRPALTLVGILCAIYAFAGAAPYLFTSHGNELLSLVEAAVNSGN